MAKARLMKWYARQLASDSPCSESLVADGIREIASLIKVVRKTRRESTAKNVAEYLKFNEVALAEFERGKLGKNTVVYYPGVLGLGWTMKC